MPNRREQKRAKHEAKRKEKRQAVARQTAPRSRRGLATAALQWPVVECWANKTWQDTAQLNQVLVVRRNPATGEVYVGLYLVDRGCLGVKNAHSIDFPSISDFRRELLEQVKQTQEMMKVDFDLAAAMVQAGLEYGDSLGFQPHRDFREASILLRDANPDPLVPTIPVGGKEGKPFYFAGPYDNAERIVAHLTRKLGPDGFHYVMPADPDMEFMRAEGAEIDDWEIMKPDDDNVLDVESREI